MPTLQSSFNHAQKVTKDYAKSFYFAARFLPVEKRKAAYAIYAFCRKTDNIVDDNPELSTGEITDNLTNWTEKLSKGLSTGDTDDIDLKAFVWVVKKYKINQNLPFELINGVEMDLEKNRYKTFQELDRYCYLVASVVGLMMLPVLGCSDYEKAKEPAIALGKAMQITNILRDIKEDYARDRVYIPQMDLIKFQYSDDKIKQEAVDQNFKDLMKYYILLAKNYYSEAEKGILYLDETGQFAIKAASRIYGGILDEIEKQDYNIYTKRARVSGLEKIKKLFRIWFGN